MKDSRGLSSVQALDDYFDALLVDDSLPQAQDTDATAQQIAETAEFKPQPVLVEPITHFHGATLTKEERDLSSVEKLLSQLQLEEDLEVEIEVEEEELLVVEAVVSAQVDALAETLVTEAQDLAVDIDTKVDTATEVIQEAAIDIAVETETTYVQPEVAEEIDIDTTVEAVVEAVVDDVVIEQVEEIVIDHVEIDQSVNAETDTETQTEPETQADEDIAPPWQNIASEYAFQVLFFESFGVTYAVPLAELGGIHKLEDCNHLIGRPDWYLGLQTERDQQLDVVDTAMWVMPEKITDNSHRDGYSYIVILGDSKWGLACNTLLGTESLKGEQVRWREQAGKRPWLAGLVKQKMCALIHVEALIAMLNQGIDANALV
ncbi:chemotaxis protein CheW [Enterovibrio sp. 27052020O]|uniref:chemotaxis protein CheW n=1 Tax=Enterovibrio sp. 27052020O TaxID=3241166 RepID=UPI00388F2E6D